MIRNMAEARLRLPPTYTIYDHPRDFPDHVVIRMWFGSNFPHPYVCILDTIEEARAMLEEDGLYCLGRDPSDDPAIVETWI